MDWVYVLQNAVGRFYVGQTDNLDQRPHSHNRTDSIRDKFTRQQMLALGHEGGAALWDPKGGPPLSKLPTADQSVRGIVFLPDGKTMVTRTSLQDFRVWDISARTNIVLDREVPGHLNEIWAQPRGRPESVNLPGA